jgi:penicillin G amidase
LFLLFLLVAAAAPAADTVAMDVTGLARPAEILVDRWGVPHIYAKTFDDVFFVQGFNAARDRLFQIDLWRRRGLGELAEIFGPAYVEQDKAARLFLFRGEMRREWAAYGPDARRIAAAFAAGINSYIDWLSAHPDRLPIEFRLLSYKPAKWSPDDVVRIRSHGLTRNLTNEVARAKTVCRAGSERGLAYDLIRSGLQPPWTTKIPEGTDPCLPGAVLDVFRLAAEPVRFGAAAAGEGSNNWAIAPARSATGRALLASDPHRAFSTPSLRYIVHLNGPGVDLVGGGEPAAPGISIGQNGAIAFGLTIFPIDQEDLYVYELNPASPREYRYQRGWESMRVVRESVRVKGAAPVTVEFLFTRHGPVIFSDGKRAYAARSCWFEPGMSPYYAGIGYMRARNFEEFRSAVRRWGAPTVNHVYADVKGNIGWAVAGFAPKRPNWDGLLPVAGDGRYEWSGFWRGEDLPRIYNPPSGYVTTSNEMNLPADYPYRERKPGFEWANGSRHARIDEVLRSLPQVSIEDCMRLQNDTVSIPARRLVKLVSRLQADNERARSALALLRGWDGAELAGSAQAALYEVWMARHLRPAFRAALLPKAAAEAFAEPDVAVMLDLLEQPDSRLDANRRDALLLVTLAAAWDETAKLLGRDPKAWQWGTLHQSLPAHPLLEVVDAATRARLQVGPFPAPAGPFSPNQSAYVGRGFRLSHGASFRVVVDVGNWDNSRVVNYPGQSGDPDSPHYRDMTGKWRNGEYFPLLYTRAAIEKAMETRIVLRPAK